MYFAIFLTQRVKVGVARYQPAHGRFIFRKFCQQRSNALDHGVVSCLHEISGRSPVLLPRILFVGLDVKIGLALHLPNLLDDFGIGQRGDIAGILVV